MHVTTRILGARVGLRVLCTSGDESRRRIGNAPIGTHILPPLINPGQDVDEVERSEVHGHVVGLSTLQVYISLVRPKWISRRSPALLLVVLLLVVVALSRPPLLQRQGDDRLYLRPPRAPRDLVQFAVELVGLVERAPLRAVVVRVPLARRVPRGLIDASPGDGVVRFDRFPRPRPMDGDPAVVLRSNTCPEKS